jgi:hypothetical protein
LRFNTTVRGALDSLGWLPDRPVLAASVVHGISTSLAALVVRYLRERNVVSRTEMTTQLTFPLAAGAAVSLLLAVPLVLWRWYDDFAVHAAYALVAAIAWGAVALTTRWKWAISALQAMLALAPALLLAGGWRRVGAEYWFVSAGHVQGQLVLIAYGAVAWSLVRRLSSQSDAARRLLHAKWPAVDQMLLVLATVVLPLWTLLASVPAVAWELGFDVGGDKPFHPLLGVAGGGWLMFAAVLAAIVVSLWERVSAAALISLGIASFAAVWLTAQFWHETNAVASAARWAAGAYAVAWALPFIFRGTVRAAAKRIVWLRWERKRAARSLQR